MASSLGNRLDDPQYRDAATLALFLFLSAALVVVVGRLFFLQIVQGGYHERLSEQNSVRLQVVKAPRGLIYDRNGVVLARNRPSYQIALLPTEIRDRAGLLRSLLRFRDERGAVLFDSQKVAHGLERSRWRKFQPQVIYEDAPFGVVALVEEHQADLPGVIAMVESRRSYPFGKVAGHVLGYMDEVREEEVRASETVVGDSSSPYARGDRIGRHGLEHRYEAYFRGRDGLRYVKVNAFGREIEVINEMPKVAPRAGYQAHLTLDIRLQCYAESLLSDTVRGAVVALDPRNGEVLVMASTPRMDGNVFSLSRERRAREWALLALDSTRPLNNRAVSGGYEPGSTFKGVVSLASLQSGKIRAEDRMARSCNGGYRFGNRVWKCWDPKGHGSLGLVDAFTRSCDTYYYQVGLILGMDPINRMARHFGFGEKTGIDLDEEQAGLLMDSTIYTARFGSRGWQWSRGLILNLSIGQGQIATPLQLANYAGGLAVGNALYRPRLLKDVQDGNGVPIFQSRPQVLRNLQLSEGEWKTILSAMDQVVNSAHGTAGRARLQEIRVGGKTGSSENPHGEKTHALFICAAPLDNPRIAIAVVLENVGHGGTFAAPIAGALLRRFFEHVPPG